MSLLNQGFPQPLVAPVALAVAQASARPVTGALGAAAPVDTYAANGFDPDYVADFSAANEDYFRVAGNDSDYATAFTADSEGGGLAVQNDSSGNVVWRAHNLLTYSEQFDNAAWAKSSLGTGSNPVVTANAGVAPDGTATADRVEFDRGAGTSLDFSLVRQDPDASGVAKRRSLWVKSNTGSNQTFLMYDGSGSVFETFVATSSWQRFDLDSSGFAWNIGTREGGTYGGDQTLDLLLWGAHAYRSDLGGMADVPADQRVASGADFAKYVPTTTAARFLARRRHHYWTGSAYAPTCLHEPVGATNDLSYSTPDSNWTNGAAGNLTFTENNAAGIDGNTSATTLTESAVSDGWWISEGITSSTGLRCMWAIVRLVSGSRFVQIRPGGLGTGVAWANFDLTGSGSVDSSGGTLLDNAGILQFSADYYLCWMAADYTASPSDFNLYLSNASSEVPIYVGDPNVTVAIAHAQVEDGAFPSSPIITNGSTVTRTADTLKGKAASFPWSSTAVSMAIKGRHNRVSGAAATLLARYEDVDDSLELRVDSSNNAEAYAETGGSSQTASGGAVATGAGAAFSLAMRYVAGSAIQVATGGTAGSEVTASVPATPPLSDNDVLILEGSGTGDVNGTVDRVIGWDEDIAEAGIESGSASVEIQGLPTISGTEAVGSTLTASAATVVGGPSPSTTWQWQRSANGTSGWADISGATSSTYTLVSADEDQYVRAVQTSSVTAGGDTYTDSANSVASGQVSTFSGVTWDSSADTYTQTLG